MIVAVVIAALIATARVADVPAARSTAITVHVPAAKNDSTKMQEKKRNHQVIKFLLDFTNDKKLFLHM